MDKLVSDFSAWMKHTTQLSESSIYKYAHAIMSISNDMSKLNVIDKALGEMTLTELDCAIAAILKSSAFIEKNTRGNNMYSCCIKQFRCFRTSVREMVEDYQAAVDLIDTNSSLLETERESLIRSRIGQGKFRTALLEKYHGACIITGITLKSLLIASHIKPWAVCNNEERLSTENGLLLCANYDRLFDCGLISFNNNGHIMISRYISKSNREKLHLKSEIVAHFVPSAAIWNNLEYHRDVVFLS